MAPGHDAVAFLDWRGIVEIGAHPQGVAVYLMLDRVPQGAGQDGRSGLGIGFDSYTQAL
jgi:hypothetical protein